MIGGAAATVARVKTFMMGPRTERKRKSEEGERGEEGGVREAEARRGRGRQVCTALLNR